MEHESNLPLSPDGRPTGEFPLGFLSTALGWNGVDPHRVPLARPQGVQSFPAHLTMGTLYKVVLSLQYASCPVILAETENKGRVLVCQAKNVAEAFLRTGKRF